MKLAPPAGDNPRDILRALRPALHGAGPALSLGGAPADEVPAGTAVVATTSGSSGIPKSVVLSRDALISSAMATAARIGSGAWLLALPATYVAGLQVLVRALVADHEPSVLAGPFSPQAFTAAANTMVSMHHGARLPAFTSLVPAQLTRLLDAADSDAETLAALRSFEAILIGGQALPAPTLARAHDVGVRIVRTYGSTETSGGCVYDGRALDGVELRVTGGELQISGPTLATGYLGDPVLTDTAFVQDAERRWYRTGDAATITDGLLRIDGRIDNVIVSGGINISLDRVERVVRAMAGLASAVVVGVEDDRWGEASVIVCAHADARGIDESELLAAARDAVAADIGAHARPSRVVLVDQLPLLASGKPDRRAILDSLAR